MLTGAAIPRGSSKTINRDGAGLTCVSGIEDAPPAHRLIEIEDFLGSAAGRTDFDLVPDHPLPRRRDRKVQYVDEAGGDSAGGRRRVDAAAAGNRILGGISTTRRNERYPCIRARSPRALEDDGDGRVGRKAHRPDVEIELGCNAVGVRARWHQVSATAGREVVVDRLGGVARRRVGIGEQGNGDVVGIDGIARTIGHVDEGADVESPGQEVRIAVAVGIGVVEKDLGIGIVEAADGGRHRPGTGGDRPAEGVGRILVPFLVEVERRRDGAVQRRRRGVPVAGGEARDEVPQHRAPLVVGAGVHRQGGIVAGAVGVRETAHGGIAQRHIDAVGQVGRADRDGALNLAGGAGRQDEIAAAVGDVVGVESGVVPDVVTVGRAVEVAGDLDLAGAARRRSRRRAPACERCDVAVPLAGRVGRAGDVVADRRGGRDCHAWLSDRIPAAADGGEVLDAVGTAGAGQRVPDAAAAADGAAADVVAARGAADRVGPRIADDDAHRDAEAVDVGEVARVGGGGGEGHLEAVVAIVQRLGAGRRSRRNDLALGGDLGLDGIAGVRRRISALQDEVDLQALLIDGTQCDRGAATTGRRPGRIGAVECAPIRAGAARIEINRPARDSCRGKLSHHVRRQRNRHIWHVYSSNSQDGLPQAFLHIFPAPIMHQYLHLPIQDCGLRPQITKF